MELDPARLAYDPTPVDAVDVTDAPDLDDTPDADELPDADDTPDADELPEPDDEPGATVVAGAFPASADDLVVLEDLTPVEIDQPTEAHDMPEEATDFDLEIASVAPAGIAIAAAGQASGDTLMAPETTHTETEIQVEDELEGRSMSSIGWLWWMVGAVLAIVIVLFVLVQCGDDDDGDGVATGDDDATDEPTVEPTPDPVVIERQATLDGILVNYPNVQGEVFGDVAVLDGTVADDTERATLDQEVRAAGLGVQNNVTVAAAPGSGADGYTLNDQIDVQPELTTLKSLLAQAGLEDALSGGGEFTLFAPTNDAFAAVSDQLAAVQDDPQALQDVLLYHLLVGPQNAAELAAAGSVPTQLDGQSITVESSGDTLLLNGTVQVLATAAPANNGLMHVVSGVLLPNLATELPEEIGVELGLAPITFGLGSSDLTDEGKAEVDKVVAYLLENPGDIEIGGHTDSDGDTALNLTLSQDRADAVRDYMAEQGIPAESMTAVGYGEEQPIAANDTNENKAKNRRIEFRPT